MGLFEAYAITTLIPNMGTFFGITAAIEGGLGAIIFVLTMDHPMLPDEIKWGKRLLLACFISALISTALPSTQQMAATLGLRLATSENAQEIYGEAGSYLKAWLKKETADLNKEEGK